LSVAGPITDKAERGRNQRALVVAQRFLQRHADRFARAFHKAERAHGGLEQYSISRKNPNFAEPF